MAKTRKRQDEASGPGNPVTSFDPTAVRTSGHGMGGNGNYGDRVALRAYELFLARGGSDGRDFDDWLTAERELAGPRDDNRHDERN